MIWIKRFFYYFFWSVLIGAIYYLGIYIKDKISISYGIETSFNYIPVIIYTLVFPVIMGILLRLPKLITEIKENKKWTLDWKKFTAIALPTISIFVIYTFLQIYILSVPAPRILLFNPGITIAGIVLGYTFLDSLKK